MKTKNLIFLLLTFFIFGNTASFGQKTDEVQPEGTNLTPWVKVVLSPMLEAPLQTSLALIYDQGYNLNFLHSEVLVYAQNSTRPSNEERNDFNKMNRKSSFTISFVTCGIKEGEELFQMWSKKIKMISLRSEMENEEKISESIRELTLFSNAITNSNPKVETFAESESIGTRLIWNHDKDRREYIIVVWKDTLTSKNWITYHIRSADRCI